jgi:hypothetical protein
LSKSQSDKVVQWLKEGNGGIIDPKSVKRDERCSICMRGGPMSTIATHSACDCPLIKSFNKMRTHGRLRPVVITTKLEADLQKQQMTVEKLREIVEKGQKELRDLNAALLKRIEALEGGKGKKRGAPAEASSSTPKKAKKETPAAGKPKKGGARFTTAVKKAEAKGKGKETAK